MKQLIVRRLDPAVVEALRVRAAKNGRSAEAEHRAILEDALLGRRLTRSLKEIMLAMPDVGTDADFARVEGAMRDVEL